MQIRARTVVLILSAGVACGAPLPLGGAAVALSPCTGKDLTATFRAVAGSAGAGHIVYALRLRNKSESPCFVTGIPGLTLLNRKNEKLPTRATAAHPSELTAVLVTLAPGRSARAAARFSPDVPGSGEPATRACEPTADGLRVIPNGGGTLVARVNPPTPVCEHGSMLLTVLTAA